MSVRYTRVGWQDAPSTDTPIDAANLNHMDNGILALSEEVDTELPLLQEQINDISTDIDTQIDEKVPPEVSSWLTEHVDPVGSAVVVDDSLTIQGAAADAKKTGDEISDLKDGLTAVESDVTDLKEDLSESVGDLKSALKDETKYVFNSNGVPETTMGVSDFLSDEIYLVDGTHRVYGGDWVSTDFVPCYGAVIDYKGYTYSSGNTNIAVVAFFDADKNMTHCIRSSDVVPSGSTSIATAGTVKADAGDYYVRVVSYISRVPDSFLNVNASGIYAELAHNNVSGRIGVDGTYITIDDFTSHDIFLEDGTYKSFGDPWVSTDYIDCIGSKIVEYTAYGLNNNNAKIAYISFFDETKNMISCLKSSDLGSNYNAVTSGTANIPANAVYLRVVGRKSFKCYAKIAGSELSQFNAIKVSNANIMCIGDSLTRGVIDRNVNIIRESYPFWLGKMLSSNVINCGTPGGRPDTWWSNKSRYDAPTSSTDLVLIMFGTNGGIANTLSTDVEPYDDYNDYANTAAGAYCKIIEWIMEQTSNHAQIILLTPPMNWVTTGTEEYAQAKYNDVLNSRPAIQAIGQRYALPVIDVFYECGMNRYNGSVFRPDDGMHFSAGGYHKLGSFIAHKIASMYSTFSVGETGTIIP